MKLRRLAKAFWLESQRTMRERLPISVICAEVSAVRCQRVGRSLLRTSFRSLDLMRTSWCRALTRRYFGTTLPVPRMPLVTAPLVLSFAGLALQTRRISQPQLSVPGPAETTKISPHPRAGSYISDYRPGFGFPWQRRAAQPSFPATISEGCEIQSFLASLYPASRV